MRILVAEDHAATCLVLEASVTSLGHDCVVATNGKEAWRLFEAVDVEVVISDRMMPGMDGVELCRRIRACAGDPAARPRRGHPDSRSRRQRIERPRGVFEYLGASLRGDVGLWVGAGQPGPGAGRAIPKRDLSARFGRHQQGNGS